MNKSEHVRLETRTLQNLSSSLPSIPLQIYSLCLQKSELKDPKPARQEMSKAGKRMWSEKEWILGPSQSKQAAQVRAGGRGLLAEKAISA